MAGDAAGTPTASPMVLFRIGEEAEHDPAAVMAALGPTIVRVNEHAKSEAKRTGDALAFRGEFAPRDVLQHLYPVVGAARPNGEIDHVLRVPAATSLAAGTMAAEGIEAPARTIATNLRQALQPRPSLRLLGTAGE